MLTEMSFCCDAVLLSLFDSLLLLMSISIVTHLVVVDLRSLLTILAVSVFVFLGGCSVRSCGDRSDSEDTPELDDTESTEMERLVSMPESVEFFLDLILAGLVLPLLDWSSVTVGGVKLMLFLAELRGDGSGDWWPNTW